MFQPFFPGLSTLAGSLSAQGQLAGALARPVFNGQLRVAQPQRAAEHFLSMIKGACHLRLLIGCCEAPKGEDAEEHVADVVQLFLRAYRPN